MAISRGWAAIFFFLGACGVPAAQAPTVEVGSTPQPPPSASAAPSAAPSAETRAAVAKAGSLAELERELAEVDMQVLGVLRGNGDPGVPVAVLQAGGAGASGLRLGSAGGGTAQGSTSPGAATVKGPRAAVAIGSVAVSGGSVGNAAAVAAGMAAGFRRCVQKALNDNPGGVTSGTKLRLSADVGPSGEVVAVRVLGASAGLPAVTTSCLLARVSSAQFAPPDTGKATVVIPVQIDVSAP